MTTTMIIIINILNIKSEKLPISPTRYLLDFSRSFTLDTKSAIQNGDAFELKILISRRVRIHLSCGLEKHSVDTELQHCRS